MNSLILRIIVDPEATYGVYYLTVLNGRENRLEPFKSLHGLSQDEIVEYSLDHIEWVTKMRVTNWGVEYAEGENNE
jgi:hypothetical protein